MGAEPAGRPSDRPASLAEALDRLTKVELHCHVEGAIRPATVVELAAKNGVSLPVADPRELYRYDSLNEFLAVFFLVQGVVGDRGDWARIAHEAALDGAAHGLLYRESFFTPARLMAAGQPLGEIVAGLDEGYAAAEAETGVRVAAICDFDREFGPAVARQTAEELVALRRAGAAGIDRVIGVGYDSIEIGQDPGAYAEAFHTAAAGGLRRTAHQGENSGPDAIAACVDLLGAERIDHGLSILDDADVVARFVDQQIALTVCPNSNIRIANAFAELGDHVYPAMRRAGLLATLNTDDPAMTDLDLGYEYASAAEAFGYGWDDMVDIALDGVRATWLEPADRAAISARIEADRQALRPA